MVIIRPSDKYAHSWVLEGNAYVELAYGYVQYADQTEASDRRAHRADLIRDLDQYGLKAAGYPRNRTAI